VQKKRINNHVLGGYFSPLEHINSSKKAGGIKSLKQTFNNKSFQGGELAPFSFLDIHV